ncbi:glutathione peroxidase [Paenibacillus sacheonensis]|uniref:Glutathione peroxidase n=1 Tax=Paenibacillus sacheonensis TaxID=742054 RepID=A0A7X4YU39_9BACL|nr:glutathione peroxidase [Paenibacillus sacheonensis]MBM7569009.1 glutathione peroxidase [Paenibacillus sacheonensis]NBC72620.1 redoxin domain-containing protein [Paenibacillus sacheonensis]
MSVYDFTVHTSRGEQKPLSDYRGKVLLIVNTATKCGLAPQFKGLEQLHQKYKDEGLAVLGFPCNQFREQEPVKDSEMQETCQINFGVTFPLLGKIDVNGPDADPLYKYLKKEASGFLSSSIKWNFTKFLVDAEGRVVKRFSPTTKPNKIEGQIRKLLEGAKTETPVG